MRPLELIGQTEKVNIYQKVFLWTDTRATVSQAHCIPSQLNHLHAPIPFSRWLLSVSSDKACQFHYTKCSMLQTHTDFFSVPCATGTKVLSTQSLMARGPWFTHHNKGMRSSDSQLGLVRPQCLSTSLAIFLHGSAIDEQLFKDDLQHLVSDRVQSVCCKCRSERHWTVSKAVTEHHQPKSMARWATHRDQ